MVISFAKKCKKGRCPIFSPCFGVIPGHPVITPTDQSFSQAKVGHWKTLCGVYSGIPTCGAPC